MPSAKTAAPTPTRPVPAARSAATSVSPARLDSTALLGQIARLDTETSRRTNADMRSKRVSPSDTQSPEGFYIAAWLRKVEQIGETNFPEVARRLNLSIGPVLEVAIGADGALREVRVARSSGNAELDRAAQKIVRLGAPYAPFPPELRQKWDVLRIARPWRFDASGQLQVR
ncbi:MAG: energy transducer TonB [Synechococcaceae cyanobacterium SM1_2_3]|nr:energy transducer TonB [Synechococcaceae cyanobacterium SM1_2_3]